MIGGGGFSLALRRCQVSGYQPYFQFPLVALHAHYLHRLFDSSRIAYSEEEALERLADQHLNRYRSVPCRDRPIVPQLRRLIPSHICSLPIGRLSAEEFGLSLRVCQIAGKLLRQIPEKVTI